MNRALPLSITQLLREALTGLLVLALVVGAVAAARVEAAGPGAAFALCQPMVDAPSRDADGTNPALPAAAHDHCTYCVPTLVPPARPLALPVRIAAPLRIPAQRPAMANATAFIGFFDARGPPAAV